MKHVKDAILALNPEFVGRVVDVEQTIVFLRAYFMGKGMSESLRALGYMQLHHEGQTRSDGQPYIVHPLAMASHAVSINDANITDDLIATLLLHDLRDDAHVAISEMPFNVRIKNGVNYIDSLQDAVESQGDEKGNKSDEIYILSLIHI